MKVRWVFEPVKRRPDSPGDLNLNWAQLDVEINTNPVPEPATMLLLGTGLIGLAGVRRKFRKQGRALQFV